jgi:hypothetical protein
MSDTVYGKWDLDTEYVPFILRPLYVLAIWAHDLRMLWTGRFTYTFYGKVKMIAWYFVWPQRDKDAMQIPVGPLTEDALDHIFQQIQKCESR